MKLKLTALLVCLFFASVLFASSQSAEDGTAPATSIAFESWLVAGPVPVMMPAFDEEFGAVQIKKILSSEHVDRAAWPVADEKSDWLPGAHLEWTEAAAGSDGGLILDRGEDTSTPLVAFAVVYVTSTHYQEVTFSVSGTAPFVLFVDGEEKAPSMEQTDGDGASKEATATCALIRGKHSVMIKTLCPPEPRLSPWTVAASVEPAGDDAASIILSTSPERTFADMERVKEFSSIGGYALSPDGGILAVVFSKKKLNGSDTERHLELIAIPEGRTIERLDASPGFGDMKWSPDGRRFGFKRGGKILAYNPSTKKTTTILKGVKGLGKYVWTPDSRFVVYTASEKKEKGSDSHYHLRGAYDRLTDYSETKSLYIAPVDGSAHHRISVTGEFAMEDFALSPDGKRIVFVKRYPVDGRPYFKTEFWIHDLAAQKTERLIETAFPFENAPSNLTWSPDGGRVAFIAPPDQIGAAARSEKEHNFFENDLWMLDVATRALSRISDRFDEAVNAPLFWHPQDGCIYFNAHNRTRKQLARIAVDGDTGLERLNETPAVVSKYSAAANGNGLAFTGSSIDNPVALYFRDAASGETRMLRNPNEDYMARMKLGKWKRYDFINSRGQKIDGFVFYPPDFEEGKKYPLLVYYYGGATPEVERFSVTYYLYMPANGYMLYVPNPVGACGYGEAFSDLHVNDQGWLAGEDILEGLEKLIADEECIDAENIGAYGGSYGGFMTLSLITRTDRFKASCSMYGISNIASYWGAGIWGYTYGDTAMARSYPWNRRDIFVDRAPLFNADKVQSALLLLHGTDDVNVPVVESEQMFTALKVLGKDVAYVRFPGEDHGIASTTDKYILHRRMVLEWFDKHLKNQPEAWEARFGE